ncbi:hypothetical protein ACA910_012781 [Epithemia clementina (nom. ined.)]
MDGEGGGAELSAKVADEETKTYKPMDVMLEEKKQADPTEEDGATAVKRPIEQTTMSDNNQDNPDATATSATDALKQTLTGAALHSSAPVKVTTGTKSTVNGTRSKAAAQDKTQESSGVTDQDAMSSPNNQSSPNNDDEDSSNDDSSYFADPNNLPSPGEAGRKYSFSSHHSTTKNAKGRESDASLSLSEDSEDENNHGGNTHVYGPREAPEVFPQQRITRMHSVGSLVSTSSQNTDDDMAMRREHRHASRGYDNHNNNSSSGPPDRIMPSQAAHLMYPAHGQPQPYTQGLGIPSMVADNLQYHIPQSYNHQLTVMGQEQWLSGARNDHNMQNPGGPMDGSMQQQQQYNDHMRMNGGPSSYQNSGGAASGNNTGRKTSSRRAPKESKRKSKVREEKPEPEENEDHMDVDGNFKVYWQRWIMLLYMSVLNLLSDWTCYSVAPIALLTKEAFGEVDPEELVTIFLAANAVASACEPIILSRLGLRRTVLFGALLLMIGSMIKSGGMPPIIQANLEKGHSEWQIYIGFFMVGLSQPLYQCTPALLSASWFPERERTMATGVALNANQLGIGFAFIFGTLLVADSDDIPGYFGLLSIVSTVAFFGTLFQFDDAPPTPPSDSARVMRGTLEVNLPSVQTILQSIGVGNQDDMKRDIGEAIKDGGKSSSKTASKHRASSSSSGKMRRSSKSASGKKSRAIVGGSPTADGRRHSRRGSSSRKHDGGLEPQAPAPSAALWGSVTDIVSAPSPMMPGPVVGGPASGNEEGEGGERRGDQQSHVGGGGYPYAGGPPMYHGSGIPSTISSMPPMGYPAPPGYGGPQGIPGYGGYPPMPQQGYSGYQMGYQMGYPQYPYGAPQAQQFYPPVQQRYSGGPYSYQHYMPRPDQQMYSDPYSVLPPVDGIDAGAEPVLTITPHHLDIDIRDDQIILAIRACFARAGFIHSLVSFTVSGIVINTLSTYMDYLVRLNGAGREYTGIIGGSFQVVIMISSLIIGGLTDKSRAYYSVTIGMLVVGAFGLAECGVSLNADRGSDLRVALIVVAALVGPLQPVSTELGVEVVYPLSENTVLVIQQLFSNLLSALFIPLFKQLKDIGIGTDEEASNHPPYTFSFYLLIVLHAGATVFFATFNGRYLRFEHELQKKDAKERKRQDAMETASVVSMGSFQHSLMSGVEGYDPVDAERQPLVVHSQVV